MTELETLRESLAHVHELGRILACNPALDDKTRIQTELSIRTLLSVLYTRLNEVELPGEKIEYKIKSHVHVTNDKNRGDND